MKKFLLLGLCCLTMLTISSIQDVNAQEISQEMEVSEFGQLYLYVSADVWITKGESTSMKVEGEKSTIAQLNVKNEGSKLSIGKNNQLKRNSSLKIYVTTPHLSKVVLAGSGNITSEDTFSGSGFDASVSGSGNITVNVDVRDFDGTISGSGNIRVSGKAQSIDLTGSGSGNFSAFDLLANDADISIMGSGNADVNVSGDLDVRIMGSGNVTYIGDPEIDFNKMGSGSVAKK